MPTDLQAVLATAPTRHVLNGPTMGTRYAAVFFAAPTAPLSVIGAALQAAVDEVDRQMSTWTPDSDLMRFNRASVGDAVPLPRRLLTVIAAGLEVGRQSRGAFDIGVGDLVAAWGFGRRNGQPDAAQITVLAQLPRRAAHEALQLDLAAGQLIKLAPVTLDLSGIAKGYGVDRLAEVLEDFGIASYLVSIDGELRAGARKPDGRPWQVALEKPEPGVRDIAGVVDLEGAALATSGDYRHRVTFEGRSHSHSMNPLTGMPLDGTVASATVRAPTCMLADAWATALLVATDTEFTDFALPSHMDGHVFVRR
jgi:thiamine biosynthesis lipoprotein